MSLFRAQYGALWWIVLVFFYLQEPVCAGPAIPAPAVTYTGDLEITVTFVTDAAYSSYELVINDVVFYDGLDSFDTGRTLTKSGISSSPFVVNMENIGEFNPSRSSARYPSAFPGADYALLIVGVEGDGSRTSSADGLHQGSTGIKEQPGAVNTSDRHRNMSHI